MLAHYSGVNVQDLENFRKLSRNSGVEVKVIKNSLFRLALEGSSFTSLSEHSSGLLFMVLVKTLFQYPRSLMSFLRKMTVLRLHLEPLLISYYLIMKLKFLPIFHQEKSYCQNWFQPWQHQSANLFLH